MIRKKWNGCRRVLLAAIAAAIGTAAAVSQAVAAELRTHEAHYDISVVGVPGIKGPGTAIVRVAEKCGYWETTVSINQTMRLEFEDEAIENELSVAQVIREVYDHKLAVYWFAVSVDGERAYYTEGEIARQGDDKALWTRMENGEEVSSSIDAGVALPFEASLGMIENLESGAATFSMLTVDFPSGSMIELRVTDIQPYSGIHGIEDPGHLLLGPAWEFKMDMGQHAQNIDAIMTDDGITVLASIPLIPGIYGIMRLTRVRPLVAETCESGRG